MGAEGGIRAGTDLPFDEALRFFRGKANLPTRTWRDLLKEQHDGAFVVAGVTKADLLADLRGAVDKALAEGTTLETFQKSFEGIIARHGWVPEQATAWRAKVILETNLRTAYAAGRHAQLTDPAFLKRNPFWEWRHGGSVHPRPQHLAWDGMVLPASDPFWASHSPPEGWGCKCRKLAHSEGSLKRAGLEVGSAPNAPSPEPGWDYSPGASVRDRVLPVAEEKAQAIGGRIGADLRREIEAFLKEMAPGAPTRQKSQTILPTRPEGGALRSPAPGDRPGIHRTPEGLHPLEDRHRGEAVEHAFVFHRNGRVLARQALGEQGGRLSRELKRFIRGNVLSHTHPVDLGFSVEDVRTAATHQAAELRAVSPNHLHRLLPPKGGWNEAFLRGKIEGAYERAKADVLKSQLERVKNGADPVSLEREQPHEIWTRVAKELGMTYERT